VKRLNRAVLVVVVVVNVVAVVVVNVVAVVVGLDGAGNERLGLFLKEVLILNFFQNFSEYNKQVSSFLPAYEVLMAVDIKIKVFSGIMM